jgi:hypothetical protein
LTSTGTSSGGNARRPFSLSVVLILMILFLATAGFTSYYWPKTLVATFPPPRPPKDYEKRRDRNDLISGRIPHIKPGDFPHNQPRRPYRLPSTRIDPSHSYLELARSRQTYHLMYRDNELPDASRAKLIQFMGLTVPREHWRTADLLPGETIEAFIQRTYNLSKDRQPSSTKALVEQILGANARESNPPQIDAQAISQATVVLKIPPVPVHVEGASPKDSQVRVQPLEAIGLRRAQTIDELAIVPYGELPKNDEPRNGDTTIVMIGTYSDLRAAMRRNGNSVRLPQDIEMSRNDGFVDLVMRERKSQMPASVCDENKGWITGLVSDPVISDFRQKLHATGAIAHLQERASSSPLIILDWVAPPLFHGKKDERRA